MTQVKISELPTASGTLAGSEVFPLVQSGVDYQASLTQAQNAMGIYAGTGSPTASADDGSIYLRNDGDAASTLYARVSGSWTAMGRSAAKTVTEPAGFGWQAQFDEGWDPTVITWALSASVRPTFIRFNFLYGHDYRTGGGTFIPEVLSIMQVNSIRHEMCLFYGSTPFDYDFTGFASFAASAVNWHTTNYPGVLNAISIWNEGDGTWAMSEVNQIGITRAIRSALNTNCFTAMATIPIYGPGYTHPWKPTLFKELNQAGHFEQVDGLVYHIYDTPERLIQNHQNLQHRLTGGRCSIPTYIQEYGAWIPFWQYDQLKRNLSIFKYLGIIGTSYYIVDGFGAGYGLLDSEGTANNTGIAWRDWHKGIGVSASFTQRDSLGGNVFSFLFKRPDDQPVRHMWAIDSTQVLINSVTTTLCDTLFNSSYTITGTSTVTLDSTADTLLAHTRYDFHADSAGSFGAPFSYWSVSAGISSSMVITDEWQWSDVGGAPPYINYIGRMGSWVTGGGVPYQAAISYSASQTGTLKMRGFFYNSVPTSDGISWRVRKNGTLLFERTADVTSNTHPIWLVTSVVPGDRFSIACDPLSAVGAGDLGVTSLGFYQTNATPTDFLDIARDANADNYSPLFYLYRSASVAGSEITATNFSLANSAWDMTDISASVYDTMTIRLRDDNRAIKVTPGSAASSQAILRWISPLLQTVRIKGASYTSGTGVDVYIYANRSGSNSLLYSNVPLTSASNTAAFDLTATIAAGHSIDIVAGHHAGSSAIPVYFRSAFISQAVS